MGEVFLEEERELTRIYDAILHLLGAGEWSSSRIAGLLHSRGLLASASPGVVTGILARLESLGLVTATRLWRTRGARRYYRLSSPLLGIIYGPASRYILDEAPSRLRGLLEAEAFRLLARELQFSVGELLAEWHGGLPAYTILPGGSGDVDVVVLDPRGKRALAAYEVKMGSCSGGDYRLAAERASLVGAREAGIVCLGGTKDALPEGVRVLDAEGLIRVSVEAARRLLQG